MINYDLPWNPTRLEQRLGRIHRIGQERDVYAFNFVASDSEDGQPIIEGRILHRLLEKLDQMREALGGPRLRRDRRGAVAQRRQPAGDAPRGGATTRGGSTSTSTRSTGSTRNRLRQYEEATGIALARANVDFSGVPARERGGRGAPADAALRRGAIRPRARLQVHCGARRRSGANAGAGGRRHRPVSAARSAHADQPAGRAGAAVRPRGRRASGAAAGAGAPAGDHRRGRWHRQDACRQGRGARAARQLSRRACG